MERDFVRDQLLALYKANGVELNFRYVVCHRSRKLSYYNYYPTKFYAYLAALNPRYWGCHTVVMLDIIEPVKPEVDYSSIT